MNDKNERPAAYPQPTETDNQLKNQDEYATMQPNKLNDVQEVSAPAPKEGESPSTENKSIEGS